MKMQALTTQYIASIAAFKELDFEVLQYFKLSHLK